MKHYLTVGELKRLLERYDNEDELAIVLPERDKEGYVKSYHLVNAAAHLTDSTNDEIPNVIMLASHDGSIEDFCSRACVQPDKILFEEHLD